MCDGIAVTPSAVASLPQGVRTLEEMMQERGIEVDHSTINRWVLKYTPELGKQVRPHLKQTNDFWRVDETYIKIRYCQLNC
jgi:transposase-like protein